MAIKLPKRWKPSWIKNGLFLVAVIFALSSCDDCIKTKADNVRSQLNNQLKIGDGPEKIEAVLKNERIMHSYDQYQNRYQGIIFDKSCSQYEAVEVFIITDSSKRLLEIKVFASYTMP